MNEWKSVLVTGANGFLGRALCSALQPKFAVRGVVRDTGHAHGRPGVPLYVGDFARQNDWSEALSGVDTVVHCAARVHVMREYSADPLRAFRKVNVEGTMALAEQAVRSGVRRFVFISSIGVNGHSTLDAPFSETSPPDPHSPYAVSKLEAEQGLSRLAVESDLEVVIIRPPMVYGPAAPGNFETLMSFLLMGIPLPFGSLTENQRSFIYIHNLVDFIRCAILHPDASNGVFLVSDGEDVSTRRLLEYLGTGLGRTPRLLPLPASGLRRVGSLLGRPGMAAKLCGSLQISIDKARTVLGWEPPTAAAEALRLTAAAWAGARAGKHSRHSSANA